ncbi:MAG: hypothetical protein VB859_10885 [Planctomycetaceae bacterium]
MSDQSPKDVRKKGPVIAVLGAALGIGLFAWSCVDRDPSSSTTDTSGRKAAQNPAVASSPGKTEVRWQTEEFNLAARRQLQLLAADLEADGRFDPAVVGKVATATYRGDRLRPETLPIVYNTGELVIRRHRSENIEGVDGSPNDRHGIEGLLGSLEELMADWEGWSDIHLHFKITSVDLDRDRATTRVLMESGARHGDNFVQQRARWRCVWELRAKAPPRLVELRRRSLEEVTGTAAGAGCLSTPRPGCCDRRPRSPGSCPGALTTGAGDSRPNSGCHCMVTRAWRSAMSTATASTTCISASPEACRTVC